MMLMYGWLRALCQVLMRDGSMPCAPPYARTLQGPEGLRHSKIADWGECAHGGAENRGLRHGKAGVRVCA